MTGDYSAMIFSLRYFACDHWKTTQGSQQAWSLTSGECIEPLELTETKAIGNCPPNDRQIKKSDVPVIKTNSSILSR